MPLMQLWCVTRLLTAGDEDEDAEEGEEGEEEEDDE